MQVIVPTCRHLSRSTEFCWKHLSSAASLSVFDLGEGCTAQGDKAEPDISIELNGETKLPLVVSNNMIINSIEIEHLRMVQDNQQCGAKNARENSKQVCFHFSIQIVQIHEIPSPSHP